VLLVLGLGSLEAVVPSRGVLEWIIAQQTVVVGLGLEDEALAVLTSPDPIELTRDRCAQLLRSTLDPHTDVRVYRDRMTSPQPSPVLQLRLVIEAAQFDEALSFYRDVLGLTEQAAFEGDGDARVVILEAGRATLELANPAQKRMIDMIEVGRPVSPKIRVAFEVLDAAGMTRSLVEGGAHLIAEPVETPWRSLNARLDAPADLQITLFQELDPIDMRTQHDGFGTAETGHQ